MAPFGYINSQDKFIIPAQFDYAQSFKDGLALVYLDGKSFFIDTTGQKIFDANFEKITSFKNGLAKVTTRTDKEGMINEQGELVIDTVFRTIRDFRNGLAVVEGLQHHPYKDSLENYEIGMIDTLGHFIIPYGLFSELDSFSNGLAHAYTLPDDKNQTDYVYIDMDQNIVLSLKKHEGYPNLRPFKDGLTTFLVDKDWGIHNDEKYYTNEDDYEIIIDTKGNIIVDDVTYKYFFRF